MAAIDLLRGDLSSPVLLFLAVCWSGAKLARESGRFQVSLPLPRALPIRTDWGKEDSCLHAYVTSYATRTPLRRQNHRPASTLSPPAPQVASICFLKERGSLTTFLAAGLGGGVSRGARWEVATSEKREISRYSK